MGHVRSDVVRAAELAALIQPVWIAFMVIALARSGWKLRWGRAAVLALFVTVIALLPVSTSWDAGDGCNTVYGTVALINYAAPGSSIQLVADVSGYVSFPMPDDADGRISVSPYNACVILRIKPQGKIG